MCVLSFMSSNVTVEGEEGDLRPVEPDLLGSVGLRDDKTAALLFMELCPSVCIDGQLISLLNLKMMDLSCQNDSAVAFL